MKTPCKNEEAISLHSDTFQQLWALLESGREVDKYFAATHCSCDQKTAQRILSFLKLENHIKIIGWKSVVDSSVRTPVYVLRSY